MRYEFTLLSKPIAKKNSLRPVQRKDGRLGIINDRAGKALLDRLAMQVPPEVRDLGLIDPAIEVTFGVPAEYLAGKRNRRFDRDNAFTSVVDILIDMGVMADDSVGGGCNGTITIHPAIVDESWRTTVVLTV